MESGQFGRQEDQFGRYGRELLPVPAAHHGQPDVGEDPGRLDAAVLAYPRRRPGHVRVVGAVAGQPEGDVRLHGG